MKKGCVTAVSAWLGMCIIAQAGKCNSIEELNALFRKWYAQSMQVEFENAGPVAILNGDLLELSWQKKNLHRIWNLDMRKYHQMKTMAHVPVAISLLFRRELDPREFELEIESLHRLLKSSLDLIPKSEDLEYEKQVELVQETSDLIRNLDKNNIEKIFENYIRKVSPLISFNMEKAVDHQVTALENVIGKIDEAIRPLGATVEQDLRVIIQGPLQARRDNLQRQVFEKFLKVEKDRGRILYAENLDQPARSRELLSVILLDRKISRDFFQGESRRMERDLLGEEARRRLNGAVSRPIRQPSCPYSKNAAPSSSRPALAKRR